MSTLCLICVSENQPNQPAPATGRYESFKTYYTLPEVIHKSENINEMLINLIKIQNKIKRFWTTFYSSMLDEQLTCWCVMFI